MWCSGHVPSLGCTRTAHLGVTSSLPLPEGAAWPFSTGLSFAPSLPLRWEPVKQFSPSRNCSPFTFGRVIFGQGKQFRLVLHSILGRDRGLSPSVSWTELSLQHLGAHPLYLYSGCITLRSLFLGYKNPSPFSRTDNAAISFPLHRASECRWKTRFLEGMEYASLTLRSRGLE